MKKYLLSLAAMFTIVGTAMAQQFKISFAPTALKQSFTGKVFLYLSKESHSPKDGTPGLETFPCFSMTVTELAAGAPVMLDDNAVSYPVALSDIERGDYYAQIVWDRNLGGRSIAESPGNIYSVVQKVSITKDTKKVFTIVATEVVPEKTFTETQYKKEFKAPSKLLSRFHNRPMTVDAAILLPKEYYTDTITKFPVVYMVSGYGGDYHRFSGDTTATTSPLDSVPSIIVYLDGNCQLGHCVYANSDNNGPWGDALTDEFIPQFEKAYRCNGARLLTGHSSGGWTVLWLQTQYPSVFQACWSSSPDPVDFRSFQKVNLYEEKNMFYKPDSTMNLVATVAGRIPWATQKNIYRMEKVIYRGEQMHSFDAVFSNKNNYGQPGRICNDVSGKIDSAVFEHWKDYDISLYVRTNWNRIKANLDGKVRVSVGDQDNFLLNDAVRLFEQEVKNINADFKFSYYAGDHFTVHFLLNYRKEGYQFLKDKYMDWLAKNTPAPAQAPATKKGKKS